MYSSHCVCSHLCGFFWQRENFLASMNTLDVPYSNAIVLCVCVCDLAAENIEFQLVLNFSLRDIIPASVNWPQM